MDLQLKNSLIMAMLICRMQNSLSIVQSPYIYSTVGRPIASTYMQPQRAYLPQHLMPWYYKYGASAVYTGYGPPHCTSYNTAARA